MAHDPNADPNESVLQRLQKIWLWVGIVMIVLGAGALIMPVLSSLVIGILIGWLLFISGVIAVASAFSVRGTGLFVWQLAAGLVPLLAGALLIVYPAQGLIALTLIVGIVFLLTGVAQSSFAVWMRPAPGWGWMLASAVVSIGLGVFILVALPEASAVMLGILFGFDFLSTGLAMVLIATSARQNP
ncbi:HdeD family acid-resistance protein [uncultured Marivita sp.]|uniref:HdeD family acid-resistance protein n=1 Tax=uncultured Marivita sp. TaxID=888080 RepID=UPI0026208AE0|nr:HdeD family acid-resistance protein [uncultured Marivita sp.]